MRDCATLSVRLAVPPLAIFLAALKTLLFRYARQETLVIGTAVSAGDSLEKSRGGFALVPIQTHWDSPGELSGEDLVRDLALRLAEARTNSRYSLRDLQSRAGAKDSRFGERLFNVALCVALDDADQGVDWPMFDPDLSEFLTQCDLVIAALPDSSGSSLRASFDSELFEPCYGGAVAQPRCGHPGRIRARFVDSGSAFAAPVHGGAKATSHAREMQARHNFRPRPRCMSCLRRRRRGGQRRWR